MEKLHALNDQQQEAVDHQDGPLLVVAGAGTGKTSVIVERIARLIAGGVPKNAILALTFTEKAAQEMLDRVGERLDDSYGAEMNIFTFNSFGQELLRECAIEIGLSPNLTLIGDIGKVVLLRDHLDDLGLDYFAPISKPDGQLSALADYFSKLKQQLVKPDDYSTYASKLPSLDEAQAAEKQRHTELARAFEQYIKIARSKNVIDYDDQLYLVVELLESRPNVLRRMQERYQYLLVDEFQDTNPMQARLLDLLADEHKNLMAVGDDDQSIYGWRGATLANILDFTKHYPTAKEVTLIENYRSTQQILDAAYKLIQNNNPQRLEVINKLDKKLHANLGSGTEPTIKFFSDLDSELDWIAHDIQSRIDKGQDPGSIAVLARRAGGGVSRVHKALELRDIDHTVIGMTSSLYKQPLVTIMIEALKAIVDPQNLNALYHTLSSPLFNIDPPTLSNLVATARKQFDTVSNLAKDACHEDIVQAISQIDTWRALANTLSVGQLGYIVLDETGLKDSVIERAQTSEVDEVAAQALFQWFSTLKSFEDMSDVPTVMSYLDSLESLKAEGEMIDDNTELIRNDVPVVMTVHKSKGLEWQTVYIVDCTENSFPLRRRGIGLVVPEELSVQSAADDHYNEERRLMYVAATRAKQELIMTYSLSHNGSSTRKPSRFLAEMFGLTSDDNPQQKRQTSLGLFNEPSASPSNKGVNLPNSMRSGENIVLTISQANDYLRCALDFKFRHILHVPPEPSPQARVGTVFHGFMQRINEAKFYDRSIPPLEDLQKMLVDEWPREGFLSAKQRDRALQAAKTSLDDTYHRLLEEPVPVSVEEPFRVRIPDSKLILKGRLDVVVPLPGGGIEIRDYKTSTSVNTPEKAKRATSSSKQLEMYALAWRIKHGEDPKQVALDFVQTNLVGTVKKQTKTLDNLELKLADMADKILSGKFDPGFGHEYCRHPEIK